MKSLISVIVPVYNAEARLNKCVQSILNQTYMNFELILVDDGSTDHSLNICKSFAQSDCRIMVFHQKKQGVSAARNQGIALSKGDWIAFVDADDYLSEDYLSELSLKGNNSQVVISGYHRVSLSGDIISHKTFRPTTLSIGNKANLPVWDEVLVYGTPWGKLFDSKIIKEYHISFPVGYQLHEDHQFYFDVLQHATKISTIDFVGYFYVNSGASSLSRKRIIPTWQKLGAYNSLSIKFNQIINKHVLEKTQLPHAGNFIIRLYISALILSYLKENRNREVPLFPSREIKDEIAHFHIPTSIKGRIIKFILMYFSHNLQYIVLKNIIK